MHIHSRVLIDIASGEVLERDSFEYSGPIELARGENEKAWNKSQIAKSNAGLEAGQGYGASAGAERGYLLPAFQNIAANPMSAEERAGTLSAAGGAYDAAAENASERQAKTRNSAGYGDLLDELARGRSRSMAQTSAGLDSEAFKRKMAALGGIGSIYGTDVGAQTHLLTPGQPVKQPGFWDNFILTAMGNANKAAEGMAGG